MIKLHFLVLKYLTFFQKKKNFFSFFSNFNFNFFSNFKFQFFFQNFNRLVLRSCLNLTYMLAVQQWFSTCMPRNFLKHINPLLRHFFFSGHYFLGMKIKKSETDSK